MKKNFALAVSIAITGSLLISCAQSSESTGNDSADTLSEKDIEVFQELLENKDSLTEVEIDSIITNQFGKEDADTAQIRKKSLQKR